MDLIHLIYYSVTKHGYATKRTFVLNCTNGEVVADAKKFRGDVFVCVVCLVFGSDHVLLLVNRVLCWVCPL